MMNCYILHFTLEKGKMKNPLYELSAAYSLVATSFIHFCNHKLWYFPVLHTTYEDNTSVFQLHNTVSFHYL